MVLHNAQVTGSLTLNNVNISGVTGSAAASASFASQIASLNAYTASANASFSSIETATGSLNTFSGSVLSYTSSANARLLSIETATASLNAFSGSILSYTASANARLLSIETATGSLNTYTGSNNATIASISANIASLSAGSASAAVTVSAVSQSVVSLNVYTASNDATVNSLAQATVLNAASIASLTSVTRSYATTGSNTFVAPQFINQASNAISFTSTASLYTNGGARVSRDLFVSGTTYLNNLIVYGTSSIQYITSSQVNIGTNIITVNTDTPAVRFGGLAVFDSGSTGLTGSMLWDSEKNHWVYSNPSGSSYSGGMLMSGPRSSALGSEQGTTNNALMKGQGGDHITSSAILEDGTLTSMYSTMYVSSSGNVGIGTSSPSFQLDLGGGTTVNTRLRLQRGSDDTNQYGIYGWNQINLYRANVSTGSAQTDFSINQVGSNGSRTPFYISSGGNVGIGTTSPAAELQVGKASDVTFALSNSSSVTSGTRGGIAWYNSSVSTVANIRAVAVTDNVGTELQFYTRPAAGSLTQVLTITSGGSVGVGTTSPSEKLELSGTGNVYARITATDASNAGVRFNAAGAREYGIFSDGALRFYDFTAATERMRITSDGNVGIGTTDTQTFRLAVDGPNVGQGDTTTTIRVFDTTSATTGTGGGISFAGYFSGTSSIINTLSYIKGGKENSTAGDYAAYLSFGTRANGGSPTERMRITSGGNVGIGTTSPSSKLSVFSNNPTTGIIFEIYNNATSSHTGAIMKFTQDSVADWGIGQPAGTNAFAFWSGTYAGNLGTERMRITSGGNVGIGTTSPGSYLLALNTSASQGINLNGTGTGGSWFLFSNSGTANGYIASSYHVFLGGSQTDFGVRAENNLCFGTGATERMRITSGGNLLVGTTNDLGANINANSTIRIGVGFATQASIIFGDAGTPYWNVGRPAGSGNFSISSYALTALTIQPTTGNVGIGTTSPSEKLEVNGSIRLSDGNADGPQVKLASSGYSDWNLDNYNGSFRAYYGSSEYFRITSGGKVGINNTSPNNFFDIFSGGPGQSNSVAGLALRSQGGGTFITGRIVARETSNATETIATFSASNANNERIFVKVQVVNVSAVNDYGNVHVGYALWSKTGTKSVTTMTLDTGNSNISNANVGTLSWSGDNLQYTTNGAGNYELNAITIWASARDTGVVS